MDTQRNFVTVTLGLRGKALTVQQVLRRNIAATFIRQPLDDSGQ
jgi:hypothetical protein